MDEEKKEIIEAINKIRKELGLEPYPLSYFEGKDLEELKKLYSAYFQMKEERKEKLKEKKKFKISIKLFAIIGILGGFLFSFFLFYPKLFGYEEKIEEFKASQPLKNESIKIVSFFVQYSFKLPDNNYVVVIQNNGTENITFSQILIDNENVGYEILSGSYPPLLAGESIYLKLFKKCDGLEHELKIIIENKTFEMKLEAC